MHRRRGSRFISASASRPIGAFGGVFTFIADSMARAEHELTAQFREGVTEIERSLTGPPLHLQAVDLTQLGPQAGDWLIHNRRSLEGRVLGGASIAVEALTGLALLCSARYFSSPPGTGSGDGC